MKNSWKSAAIFVIAGCLLAAIPAQAQVNNCQDFSVLLQATLDISPTGTGWSGTVRGFLDNRIPLVGFMIGGGDLPTVATGQTGHEPATWFIFDFGPKGKFVTVPDKGVFPVSPKVAPHMVYPPEFMLGSYFSSPKVGFNPVAVASGWFKDATGYLSFNGTFIVDNASAYADGTFKNMGIWNSEIKGKLCNLKMTP
jgi:hypothetical protein